MEQIFWRRWLKALFGSKPRTIIRRRRLGLELLEGRIAPASRVWDGGGGSDNRWSIAANWDSDTPIAAGDDLTFPGGAVSQKNSVNDLVAGTVINKLTFSGSDYSISGNKITLGNTVTGSGSIVANTNTSNNTLALPILLGGGPGQGQDISIAAGAVLTISGSVSSNNAVALNKGGTGTLILSGDNSGFIGPFDLTQGIVRISNAGALGSSTSGEKTTLKANAQLQLNNVGPVNNDLLIEGTLDTTKGLLAYAGTSVWAGDIEMDGTSIFGANPNTSVEVTGVISALGVSDGVQKEGTGTVIFSGLNTYGGTTTINNGILRIRSETALGLGESAGGGGVVVNKNLVAGGTLQLDAPAGQPGFTIADKTISLKSFGFNPTGAVGDDLGALSNLSGVNTWAGKVILLYNPVDVGRDDAIGAEAGSTLIVSGVISDSGSGTPPELSKVRAGTLVLPTANTYRGETRVEAGILNIRDSLALGPANSSFTSVKAGAALEIQADALTDSVNTTGTDLTVTEDLHLSGSGIGGTGALRNLVGTNVWAANVSLDTNSTIGVDPDPDHLDADALPFNDFSQLTITGQLGGSLPSFSDLTKVGTGELVLPGANSNFLGVFSINEGWVTARNNRALGGIVPSLGDTLQPGTIVKSGAALVLKSTPGGANLNMPENITLSGDGVATWRTDVNQNGALLNLSGANNITGIVTLDGTAGIGVELLDQASPPASQLTISGPIAEAKANSGFDKLGTQRLLLQGGGSYTGKVDIQEGVVQVRNDTALGLPSKGGVTVEAGAALELASTLAGVNGGIADGIQVWNKALTLNGPGNTTANPGNTIAPLTVLGTTGGGQSADFAWRGPVTFATNITIDVAADTGLMLSGTIDDLPNTDSAGSALVKVGGGRLSLAGDNSYRGLTDVQSGILNIQSSTALGAPTTGTKVALGASLELQGDVTVAGESLTVEGTGVGTTTIPVAWFDMGPAPLTGGQTPGSMNVSGRVTGIAVDPIDPNLVFISTAGGGAWRSQNGGLTWQPMFDFTSSSTNPVLFSGAIAVAPSNPKVIYLGTGEANNSTDSFYGRGVYKSTDSGMTWSLLGGDSNPLARLSISAIAVDPDDEDTIWVGASDLAVNGSTGNAGVWRYRNNSWFNLTEDAGRAEDDHDLKFPDTQASYSSVVITKGDGNPLTGNTGKILYFALGTYKKYDLLGNPIYGDLNNAVYRIENPYSSNPVAYVGDGGADNNGGTKPFPTNINASPQTIRNGVIKLTAVQTGLPADVLDQKSWLTVTTIYAAITNPTTGALLEIQKSTDGGQTWAATTAPSNYMGSLGYYDTTILATDSNTVYVAGASGILRTTDGGSTWTDVTTDSSGNGPYQAFHALAVDASGRVIAGTDGGVWRLDTSSKWSTLNGYGLQITQLNGLATNPTNPYVALAGSQGNGTALFNGDPTWSTVDGGNGGQILIDQSNSNFVYHVRDGVLRRSTNGGTTWSTILTLGGGTYYPFSLDSISTNRLVVSSDLGVQESLDQGASWHSLQGASGNALNGAGAAIALATYQGTFAADSDFSAVTDKGQNVYDPDTIYVAKGNDVYVTKNRGTTWIKRTVTSLSNFASISSITVDPTNRDIVYVTVANFNSSGRKVFKSTDAGRSWSDITGNLPNVPTWSMTIDPRSNDLYVGNDVGVYVLKGGVGNSWARVGAGLPNVQVKVLVLNQRLNTLAAGTYGRGMYQMWLNDARADAGAIRVVSGSTVWAGDITMVGNTTIGVEGTQGLQNGISNAQLIVNGAITGASDLTKRGGGTLVLSGTNTYTGLTDIKEGVVVARNTSALGTSGPGSQPAIVRSGASLELQSDLSKDLQLNGDGFKFNDHFSGALHNVSGFNTYTGTITLGSNTTLGIDGGTRLTIDGSIDDGTNSFGFNKELGGTLVLTQTDTYDGTTRVYQGVLEVRDPKALGSGGSAASGTEVTTGAQLLVRGNYTVENEYLKIAGNGVSNGGALQAVGTITWTGPVTLAQLDAFGPAKPSPAQAGINVPVATDTLTIDAAVDQSGGTYGILKSGPGRLVLTHADSYGGLTSVNAGVLNVRDVKSLGTGGTTVASGAALELQTSGGTIDGGTLTVGGAGIAPANAGAIRNLAGDNIWKSGATLTSTTTFDVAANTSLQIGGVVTGGSTSDLHKAGAGTLILAGTNTYAGKTYADAGTTQVDGKVGNVILNSGTLGGAGTVGTVTVASGATGSRVNPGNPAATGTLNSADVTLSGATTFAVDLTSGGQDQLKVTGDANLNTAALSVTVGPGLPIGDYTILTTTGSVIGTFPGIADGSIQYFGGKKFVVHYNANSVVLSRVKNDMGISLAQSSTATNYGQLVTFTATLSPEGGGTLPAGTKVYFILDGDTGNRIAADVVNNVAVWTRTDLDVGARTVAVEFDANTDYNAASNGPITHTVNKATPTADISFNPTNPAFGDTVTITLTLTPPGPGGINPSGDVTFKVDGGADQVATLSGNKASIDVAGLGTGPHTVQVMYPGAANFNNVTKSVAFTVAQQATTLDVTKSPAGDSAFGQEITFTVTVSSAAGTPDGDVQFLEGSTVLKTVTLSGGTAEYKTSDLGVGPHTITVKYVGNANFGSQSKDVTQTVVKADTTTALNSTKSPAVFGEAEITATVAAVSPGAGVPTGTVTFHIDNGTTTVDQDVDLVNGVATLIGLHPGSYTITATYKGTGSYNTSDASTSLSQVVEQADSKTVLGTTNADAVYGEPTITATVTAQAPASGTPTGKVTFHVKNTDTNVTTDYEANLDASGVATLGATLDAGNYSVTATYGSDTDFKASDAAALIQKISPAQTKVALSASTDAPTVGHEVVYSVQVDVVAPGIGTPTGDVEFSVDGMVIDTVALSAGKASVNYTATTPGDKTITARFVGSTNYAADDADPLTQNFKYLSTVAVEPTTPATYGQTVTLVADLTVEGPGTTAPTGKVIFYEDGVEIGRADLVATADPTVYQASLATDQLTGGDHVITAKYEGDGLYVTSTSAEVVQTINKAATNAVITDAPAGTITYGDAATFKVQVTAPAAGPLPPGGKVEILVDGQVFATADLVGDTATIDAHLIPAGDHAITARYVGDTNYSGSQDATTLKVDKVTSAANLYPSASSTVVGNLVSFHVTVTTATGAPPEGYVTFFADGNVIGTAGFSGNTATFTTGALAVGNHNVYAVYSGSSNIVGIQSNAIIYSVLPVPVPPSGGSSSGGSSSGSSGGSSGGGSSSSRSLSSRSRRSRRRGLIVTIRALGGVRAGGHFILRVSAPVSFGLARLRLISGPGFLGGRNTARLRRGVAMFNASLSAKGSYSLKVSVGRLTRIIRLNVV